jgi:hypothetical protein
MAYGIGYKGGTFILILKDISELNAVRGDK